MDISVSRDEITTDPEAKLKALEAKLKAAHEARAKRREPTVDAKLSAAEVELNDLEVIEKANCELGDEGKEFNFVRTDLGIVIFKRPHSATFKKFQDKGDRVKTEDIEQLVKPCVWYPDRATFDSYLERWPAMLGSCVEKVGFLGGVRFKEEEGK